MDTVSHPAVMALASVIEDAANLLRLPVEGIAVEFLESRTWPDSCLGLPTSEEVCAEVMTSGFLVGIGDGFSYRTDLQGNVRRETETVDRELEVHFRQVGGLGGWSSEYHADTSSLSPADAEQVRQFIDITNFFHLPEEVGNGQPIAYMYTYTISVISGRRNHRVRTYDGRGPHESPALEKFVSWLKARAPEPAPDISGDVEV